MNAKPVELRPLEKYAELFESAPVSAPPRFTPQYGFGSRTANKAYRPPQEPRLPADFLRKPRGA